MFGGYTLKSSAGSICHWFLSSRVALNRPPRMASRIVDFYFPVALAACPRVYGKGFGTVRLWGFANCSAFCRSCQGGLSSGRAGRAVFLSPLFLSPRWHSSPSACGGGGGPAPERTQKGHAHRPLRDSLTLYPFAGLVRSFCPVFGDAAAPGSRYNQGAGLRRLDRRAHSVQCHVATLAGHPAPRYHFGKASFPASEKG